MRVQALSFGELHDQVYELWRVDGLVELDDVGVGQTAQNPDLSDGLFFAMRLLELASVVLLDRNSLTGGLVHTLFDYCVGTAANLLAEVVYA